MELVIDRGVKSYDVKDADGTLLGVIKINPADIGISGRFVSARNAIAELAEQAKPDPGCSESPVFLPLLQVACRRRAESKDRRCAGGCRTDWQRRRHMDALPL